MPEAVIAKSGSEARRKALAENFDVIVINAPLSDEFGHELAQYFSETTVAGILLIVKNELYDEMSYRVMDYGVLALARPLHREVFYQALNIAVATRERLKILEKENNRLKAKLDETRLIDRAKYILMESLQMSEMQAHKYIEKQAMDLRLSKHAVAESILKTY